MDELTIRKAYELKEILQNDERYLLLLQKEKEMEEDEEVCLLSYKKDVANAKYNDVLRYYSNDSKEAKEAQKELYEAKKELESHPKVIAYLKAYSELRKLLEEVNNILFKYLNTNICPKKEK